MAKQWRCAVIGTGTVGEWHVRVVPKLANASLVAACDTIPEKAQKALAKNSYTGIPIYQNIEEMLRKHPDIDIVHICTPSGDHMGPAELAMNAGKHVITEKPMEIHLDRIDRMAEIAKKNGVRIAGIFQNRWSPANMALKKAVEEERFGRITWAGSFTPWYRTDKYYADAGWRGTWKLDGGGAVMNQSVHTIDLLQWIVGPVKRVSAYAASLIHAKIEVEDTCSAAIEFENGAFGTILGSTAMFPGQPPRIEVGGENGTAISENGLRLFKFRDEQPEDQTLREHLCPPPNEGVAARIKKHGGDALYEEIFGKNAATSGGGSSATDVTMDLHSTNIQAILQAWDAGQDADTNPAEARKAVAIIQAIYESAKSGGKAVDVR